MKTIESLIKLFFVLGAFSSVIGQRSILVQDFDQQVSDIVKHPEGYFIFSSTNFLMAGSRWDVQIDYCRDNLEPLTHGATIYYNSDYNLYSGNLEIGPEYLDLGYPTDAAFTSTAVTRAGDIISGPRSLIAYSNYNDPIQPGWVWITNNTTEGSSKCLRLSNGDYIFLYNYIDPDLVTLIAITRISSAGDIVWEKSYRLNQEKGVSVNYNIANDMCLVSDNSIVVTGAYAFDTRSIDPSLALPTPFAFKIDLIGRVDWVRSFEKIGNTNAQFVSVRQSPHSKSIYFLGTEKLTRIPRQNIITVASLSESGNWLSQYGIHYLYLTDSLIPSEFDFADGTEKLGIVGRLRGPGSSSNFYLCYNSHIGTIWSNLNFILPNGESQSSILKVAGNKFITGRNIRGSLAGDTSDICLEIVDLDGNDSPCYSGGTEFESRAFGTSGAIKKRMHTRNINNLSPFRLKSMFTYHLSDYCGPTSGLMLSQGNNLNQVSELTPIIRLINEDILSISNNNLQNESGTIEIIDIYGRVVLRFVNCIETCEIDINNLRNGIYYVWNPKSKIKLLGKFVKS